jgi:hypothetical protein
MDVATRVGTDGKLHGEVDVERVKDIVSFVTPVRQGCRSSDCGPLMENVVLTEHSPSDWARLDMTLATANGSGAG